jgi:hypothetical protein
MQRLFPVGLIVLGAALCAWAVIAAALSPEGIGGLQLTPRSALGLGWVFAGIICLLIYPRRKDRGPEQK